MQYYEIEAGGDNKINPFLMNQITESKTALAEGLLGFQFLLVAVKQNNFVIQLPPDGNALSNTEKATDENSKVVRNYIGPCAGSDNPGQNNICNEYPKGGSKATYNVYQDGQIAAGSPDDYQPCKFAINDKNKPHSITCTTDDCSKFTPAIGDPGDPTGPGVSCQYIYTKDDGKLTGNTSGGCPKCPSLTTDYPYALGYYRKTTDNILQWTGVAPICCQAWGGWFGQCPFLIGVNATTYNFGLLLKWNNWLLGQNCYGSRILSGKDDKTNTAIPVYNTDYNLESATCHNKPYTEDGSECKTNLCTSSSMATNITGGVSGWINGEWTFPLTTQNTAKPSTTTQDTLNYYSASAGWNSMTNLLPSRLPDPSSKSTLATPPPLKPNMSTGLASWLKDLVTNTATTYYGGDFQGPGFIRDYMIVKTFASAYCSMLYGNITEKNLTDPNNILPIQARNNWQNQLADDFTDVWRGNALLNGDTAPFDKILYNQISESFATESKTDNTLPFLNNLSSMTLLGNQQLHPFTIDADNNVYLQVPVDAFRMKEMLGGDYTGIAPANFLDFIIYPLLRGDHSKNGMISTKLNQTPSVESDPEFESKGNYLAATYKYSGLRYTNPSKVFQETSKTKSGDYNTQINTLTALSAIDKDLLWPLNTHATISNSNIIVPSDGGSGIPIIECLYYITVKIKKWSPALAFLYLATSTNSVIPQQVYSKIYNDTKLVPTVYIGNLCSNKDGKTNLDSCRNMILDNCQISYTNDNFNFSPDRYFLLYNGRNSQGVCNCVNSSLVPPSKPTVYDNLAAMCFDQNCFLSSIPNTDPALTMGELLGLTDNNCIMQCSALRELLEGEASNIQNLMTNKYKNLCNQTIETNFNTTFFFQLMIPTIIITALIPLGFGINKASIIVMVLTLLTLTGVSFYLGKLFASLTECDGVSPGGKLPDCVSSMNPDMELPLSFCDINMFCECKYDEYCKQGCTCKSGVCLDKSGTRATETVYVKTINVQMLVLSSSLLILVPILIYLLRKRFFPEMPLLPTIVMIALSTSIFGTVLYLSIVYQKPRLSYKGICGEKSSQPSK